MTNPSFQVLESLFEDSAREIETALEEWVGKRPLPENLREAALYVLLAGGKRLRPLLVTEACKALGGKRESALGAAMAMEMIHTFSLVHDDLPCMDNADLRRGKATLHRRDSEAMAVLAGDLLMGLAFECLGEESPELAGRLTVELSRATNDMIAGQVYDTIPDESDRMSPKKKLERIHRLKTGALIRGSVRMGALCAGASAESMAYVDEYGMIVGLMFQIVDDWLDATQTTEQLGKDAGLDAENSKFTYVDLLGIEGCRNEVERLRSRAHEILTPMGKNAESLRQLCDWMANRTH